MRIYETGFVLAPNLSEEDTEKIVLQMADIVGQREGRLIKQEKWGKRKLAYPIKKFNEGYYVFFLYEGKGDIPLELERRFKQSDAVLRYLTVRKETRLRAIQKKRKAPEEREPSGVEQISRGERSSEEGGGPGKSQVEVE
ncbi:MAG: 30S ribosomal protein S6 [Candidatus Aminicenantales bacterium]